MSERPETPADLPALDVGDHVEDREDPDATMLVVGLPLADASTARIDGTTSVADVNPTYPAADPVVEVVFPSEDDVDVANSTRYTYPRSRLHRTTAIHGDADDDDQEDDIDEGDGVATDGGIPDDALQTVATTVAIVDGRVSMSADGGARVYVDAPDRTPLSSIETHATIRASGPDYRAKIDLGADDLEALVRELVTETPLDVSDHQPPQATPDDRPIDDVSAVDECSECGWAPAAILLTDGAWVCYNCGAAPGAE